MTCSSAPSAPPKNDSIGSAWQNSGRSPLFDAAAVYPFCMFLFIFGGSGIRLLGCIVFNQKPYYSFFEKGLL